MNIALLPHCVGFFFPEKKMNFFFFPFFSKMEKNWEGKEKEKRREVRKACELFVSESGQDYIVKWQGLAPLTLFHMLLEFLIIWKILKLKPWIIHIYKLTQISCGVIKVFFLKFLIGDLSSMKSFCYGMRYFQTWDCGTVRLFNVNSNLIEYV